MVRKRPRVEPTDDWQEILPLCWWPEQVEYERIRQPVLFGSSVPERAEETGVSERTLQRRIESFEEYGIEGLLSTEKARKRRLPPNVRRLIVDLKAEYPPFNLNEIANVVRACTLAFDEPVGGVWASDHFGVVAELSVPDVCF
jgi:putative transposase